MIADEDWRLRGQEDYMLGIEFQYIKFVPKEGRSMHAHCEFCWHKFMEVSEGVEGCSSYGYCTLDGKYWVCEDCFKDFKDAFHWKLI